MKPIKEAVREQFEYKDFVNLINKLVTKQLGVFIKNRRYCMLKAISAAQEAEEHYNKTMYFKTSYLTDFVVNCDKKI